ncbi:hypothetical protein OSB04_029667 [Centaurea solstitialis]|uniref:VQ domain-containing protein n=1 Tax=Centaurea solstitialis TaxID=347529 RepID=A0AA38S7A5_9ASTR|nr:hypothetical protein OSB04_029667 [Centaurea solstitialis]
MESGLAPGCRLGRPPTPPSLSLWKTDVALRWQLVPLVPTITIVDWPQESEKSNIKLPISLSCQVFDELPQRTDICIDMDNNQYFGSRHDVRLGVNKIGKNIRKSPPPPYQPVQPNFANLARPPPQPPQVYNINKNDFQTVVQQLTGSPLHHSQQQQQPLPRPHQNSPNPPSNRLQKIRPPRPAQYGQPPWQPPPMTGGGANTAESPISAYMRYLQHSIIDPSQGHPQTPNQIQSHQGQSSGFPSFPPFPSPRTNVFPPSFPSPRMNGLPPPFPSPRMSGLPPPFPSPRMNGSPRINGPLIPPSPNSQYLLPSPSGYFNLLSPLSSYPLISPGYQHPPPLTPIFSFSPMAQPPPSPGMGFPSPGFFQIPTPRWRD